MIAHEMLEVTQNTVSTSDNASIGKILSRLKIQVEGPRRMNQT